MAVDAATTPLAPVAMPDALWRLMGAGAAVVPVLANDLDLNGPTLSLASFDPTSARGGSVALVGGATPSLSYVAPGCLEGPDTFHYTVADPGGLTDQGLVTVSTVRAPTFLPPTSVSAPGFGIPEAFEGADLDLDGDIDLVGVYGSTPADVVVFTRGPGGFAVSGQFDITLDVQQLRVGQVTGSARPDLVAVDMVAGKLVVAPALDAGGFGPSITTTVSFPQAVAVAVQRPQGPAPLDVNGDGVPDVVVSTTGFPIVIKTMLGNGNGGFTDGPSISTPGPAAFLELADMTGDDAPELVAVIGGIGLVQVYTVLPGGQLSLLANQSTGATPIDVALGDADGDGDRDVVVVGSGVLGTLPGTRIVANTGDGHLGAVTLLPSTGTFPSSVALGDFDGDGDVDLAEANLLSNSIGVHPAFRTASGTAGPTAVAPIAAMLNTLNGASGLVPLDDNGDGLTDLAVLVTAGTGYTVRIFRGSTVLPPGAEADLDHDGSVGAGDLAVLLGAWGTSSGDVDGDGATGPGDLAVLLGWWGASSC